jgi:hypothetical protein
VAWLVAFFMFQSVGWNFGEAWQRSNLFDSTLLYVRGTFKKLQRMEAELSNKTATNGQLSVAAHAGDAKTLLAFNLKNKSDARNLVGFKILCTPNNFSTYSWLRSITSAAPCHETGPYPQHM